MFWGFSVSRWFEFVKTMRKFLQLALILIPLTAAAQNRIALLPSVFVHADEISLADLLPTNAPDSLRTQAEEISFGHAPAIGLERTLQRSEIIHAVPSNLIAMIAIPQSVIVTRWSRALTRDEVLAAIQKSMDANHASSDAPLSPSDVTFDSPIAVTEDAPSLNVVRFEPRSDNAGTHVALWTVSEPRTPPFWVTIDRNIDLAPKPAAEALASDNRAEKPARKPREGKSVASGRASSPAPISQTATASMAVSKGPQIRVGEAIELVVQGNGMRIATKATALESGREGQNIRVKSATAEKILIAKIVSAQTAEIDY